VDKKVKGIINAEVVCIDVADIIYNQGKAKVFNVLESQLEGQKLVASKHIVEDILTQISRNAAGYLKDILDDWQVEVEAGGILEGQVAIEAQQAFQKVKEVIGM
jgi:hypothetical protein